MYLKKLLKKNFVPKTSISNGIHMKLDSVALLGDEVVLYTRTNDGRLKEVSKYVPRDPLCARNFQLSPDGRQILCVFSNPLQGVSFACLSKAQDCWKYFDFFPTEFTAVAGVFSPASSHLVYLATSTGGIVELNLKTKLHTILTKGGERPGNVTNIDINSIGSQLAVCVGGSILIHSTRNKLDTYIDYDKEANAVVSIRFHPTRQFLLGVFSMNEGAAIIDLTASMPSNNNLRFKPAAGEAHICEPHGLFWCGTEALLTVASDNRIVIYSRKRSFQCYRAQGAIYCACVLKEGAEMLIGLENELVCFDIKKRQICWTKNSRSLKPVTMIARSKSHLTVSNQVLDIEAMYTQKMPQNPDIGSGDLPSEGRQSDCNLISPVRGSHERRRSAAEQGRKSSIGSLISPPRGQLSTYTSLKSLNLPARRSIITPTSTIKEDFNDADWKENHNSVMQSTALNDNEGFRGNVDFGLDSSSPVKGTRQPFAVRNAGIECTPTGIPIEKKIFCNVDSARTASQLDFESPKTVNTAASEEQNKLLASIVDSNLRIESKLTEILEEIREQAHSSRRLIDHSIQLTKVFHSRNMSALTELVEAQQNDWLDVMEEKLNGNF